MVDAGGIAAGDSFAPCRYGLTKSWSLSGAGFGRSGGGFGAAADFTDLLFAVVHEVPG